MYSRYYVIENLDLLKKPNVEKKKHTYRWPSSKTTGVYITSWFDDSKTGSCDEKIVSVWPQDMTQLATRRNSRHVVRGRDADQYQTLLF